MDRDREAFEAAWEEWDRRMQSAPYRFEKGEFKGGWDAALGEEHAFKPSPETVAMEQIHRDMLDDASRSLGRHVPPSESGKAFEAQWRDFDLGDGVRTARDLAVAHIFWQAALAYVREGVEPVAWQERAAPDGRMWTGWMYREKVPIWPDGYDLRCFQKRPLYADPISTQVPPGWKLVPIDATDEMERAGQNAWMEDYGGDDVIAQQMWDAMIAAAPPLNVSPPEKE